MFGQRPERQFVRKRSEAGNDAYAFLRRIGFVPEILPPQNIAQVHLHGGKRHRRQRIAQGDRSMRIRRRVDDDAVDSGGKRSSYLVHQSALAVGLKILQFEAQQTGLLPKIGDDPGKGLNSVYPRLSEGESFDSLAEDYNDDGVSKYSFSKDTDEFSRENDPEERRRFDYVRS